METLGFGTEATQSKTWINVNNGKLTVRAQEGDEGAAVRKYKDKQGEEKEVHEFQFPSFAGVVTGAGFEETKWGLVFGVDLDAGDKSYQLRLNCPSRLFDQFVKRIPNISAEHPLLIGAFTNENGNNVLYLKQNGSKVPMAFTKDAPNGMPDAVKTVKLGKESWDFSAQEEFLYQLASSWMKGNESAATADTPVPVLAGGEESTEDSPF